MSGPQRYGRTGELDPNGIAVLFADVEGALRDSKRLHWLMPIIQGDAGPVADSRMQALAAGLLLGKTGIDLVDFAMEGCPC